MISSPQGTAALSAIESVRANRPIAVKQRELPVP